MSQTLKELRQIASHVALFHDHLEITNPGALHFGITPEKLTQPPESKPWNPIIANVFYRAGIIERWGSGTNRVIEECKAYGIEPPIFEEKQGWVVVTFRAGIGPIGSGAMTNKTREKTREKILRAIMAAPAINTAELAVMTGLTTKGIEWNLKKLKTDGLLKRIGPAKGGRWEVIR